MLLTLNSIACCHTLTSLQFVVCCPRIIVQNVLWCNIYFDMMLCGDIWIIKFCFMFHKCERLAAWFNHANDWNNF
jgi:hypothetical protein